MSRILVCLDCPNYEKGGYCRHKRKDTGALAPACDYAKQLNQKFNPEDNEEAMIKLAPTTKTKRCNKCGRELPISEFYAKTGTKDGLQYNCKECHKTGVYNSRNKAKDSPTAQAQEPTRAAKVAGVANGLKAVEDLTLVAELRARGWEVKCTRTVIQEL